MAVDVTEATFDRDVIELSGTTPVVVDFWAEWCGPCRTLSPALEAAEASGGGRVLLAKVDVDSNQALAARYGVQGIPAVKAFRDGEVVDEFVGAVPKARVEAFFDSLVPSRTDELLEAGDELSLREASELEPRRADVAVSLGRRRLERGAEDEALEAVAGHEADFAAAGLAARIKLSRAGIGTGAFEALDRGEREAALDGLLDQLELIRSRGSSGPESNGAGKDTLAPEEARELLRQAIVGILSEDPADPAARDYRRRLSSAL
ncbi:MAG: putative thioredoxin [Solirubrobacterales bacterium]|nr:putative thioredoxin [Solirubrobacterales bacterium]